jgi:hypothetical protein
MRISVDFQEPFYLKKTQIDFTLFFSAAAGFYPIK